MTRKWKKWREEMDNLLDGNQKWRMVKRVSKVVTNKGYRNWPAAIEAASSAL